MPSADFTVVQRGDASRESGRSTLQFDVVICVHNSPNDVRRCLDSVQSTLRLGDRLLIVDDGSEAEARRVCERAAAECENTIMLRRDEGSGFCRAANAGLRETTAPAVVLLNSDTVVVRGWLDKLGACLEANWQVGLAGPLSNAGGWQSIPEYMTGGPPNNAIRSDIEALEEISKWCSHLRPRLPYPIVEQLNGFCLAMRRDVLEAIGEFNEELFPMGYGEESDFVLRAQDSGFLSAVAIDCFVYHAKTKSYSTEARKEYIKAGRAHIDRLHGADRVKMAVKGTQSNPILAVIRAEAREEFLRNGWLLDP